MRVYAGVTGDERLAERRKRLLAAGLELLASADGPQDFTVRGVCRQAELASRYFYESFDNLDDFAVAIYDDEILAMTVVTMAALEGVNRRDDEKRIRTSLRALVNHLAEDRRRGRLLYSSALASVPGVAARRRDSTRLFVGLLIDEANAESGPGAPSDAISEMLVGGLAQAIRAWLDGELTLDEDDLVEQCTQVFLDTLVRT